MARVGFLGLGDMGTPMARRLLRSGHDLVVWNRSSTIVMMKSAPTAACAGEGATSAPSRAKVTVRSVAWGTLPRTGASTSTADFGNRSETKRISSGPTVDMSITIWPGKSEAASPAVPNSTVDDDRCRGAGVDQLRCKEGKT